MVLASTDINRPVLLFKTILGHWNCFLSSVATDGENGHGLKLQKVGPTFSRFDVMPAKVTLLPSPPLLPSHPLPPPPPKSV